MENKLWEDQLRDLLGEYKPGQPPSPFGDSNSVMPEPKAEIPSGMNPDPLQDTGWKRIEASLDAADQAFDETIKHKIAHYHPKYDPHTWPVFLKRLTDSRFLRTKLIVLKSIEVAALLLLLITAVNVGRLGSFNKDIENREHNTQQKLNLPNPTPQKANTLQTPAHSTQSKGKDLFAETGNRERKDQNAPFTKSGSRISNASALEHSIVEALEDLSVETGNNLDISGNRNHHSISGQNDRIASPVLTLPMQEVATPAARSSIPSIPAAYNNKTTVPIDGLFASLEASSVSIIPEPKYIRSAHRRYTEFSILAQSDYNGLRMPEDRLFTAGRQIIFPQKGIMSQGFGGGFTVAIGHPVWALETGVIYSAKDFKPGRQLIVGGAFDNGSVEFEAMRLQVVSLPIQYRYRFDHEGRFKMYGLAGLGFNVIAQYDVDVLIKYHFPSLSFGQNPNSDPDLAETIAETRRISEHIRDGAPFSTKTFVSINGGIGAEYMLTEDKWLFLQSAIQYQIPDLEFSNNNGKHLRSISLQAGVRTPLGK